MRRRVVVTGMGVVSPLGTGLAKTWDGLMNGRSGVRAITRFDTSDYACRIAAEVPDFNVDDWVNVKDQKKMDVFIQYGMAATAEALKMAGLEEAPEAMKDRIGVLLGSGIGGLPAIEEAYTTLKERGPRRISPFFIPSILINLLPGHVSIRYGFRGPNTSTVSACATSAHAVGDAAEMIRRGIADVMVAGGAESAVCPLAVGGFAASRALSTGYNDNPAAASRPFDKDRDGFVMGEGAATLILEEYEHAKARSATIYAEVAGYGLSGDGYHMTSPAPDGNGAKRAMAMALADAGVAASGVQYVNAHATSTPAGDEIESGAIEATFGGKIAVSSTKSMTGHLLGAAGALESIVCIQAIRTGHVPPTINLATPSDNCRLDYIPHTGRDLKVKVALNNSFGFGGTNASLVFKEV
ncbi:MAG: beta-ketoacyl-ACP synthase II [Proteobacteria bacterium]|nr:beta-ketoacyl-ACP synthase II [Pseudomonadota bacterium]